MSERWLAPLRGVTIRAFREVFASPLREAGFCGAFAPFIPANPGIRVSDRLLDDVRPFPCEAGGAAEDFTLVPQVITKDPEAMRVLFRGFKDRGFTRADLNAGCPFPMIRRRGRSFSPKNCKPSISGVLNLWNLSVTTGTNLTP